MGTRMSPARPLLFLTILLSGCQAEAPPARSGATVDEARPLVAVRGTVHLAGDTSSFTPCASARPMWLEDSTAGVLGEVRRGFGAEATTMYAELEGRWIATPSTGLGAGMAGAFAARGIRRANAGEGTSCARPAATGRFVAHGSEPFWGVEVTESAIVFRSPEHLNGLTFSTDSAEHSEHADSAIWRGIRGGGEPAEITVQVRRIPCRDGMSGEYFGWSASVRLGARDLTGCAAEGFPEGTP
jgi:uncharacterized membrane protein